MEGDEIWTPVQRTLEECVNGDDVSVRQIQQIFHFPGSLDDLSERNPLLRIRHHGLPTAQNAKVCFRWQRGATVEMGNHSILLPGSGRTFGQLTYGMVIHHFPYRFEDQFVAKVRKGLAGLAAAADLPDAICSHWRAYGRILSMSGEEGLRHWYREKIFHDDSRIRQLVTDHHQFSEI